MKVAALNLAIFLAAVSAAGQVTSVKNDIPESQYLAAEAKGEALLRTASYRSVWTKEYFEDRSKEWKLQAKKLSEVVQPDRSRYVDEDVSGREESIWIGTKQFVRKNDDSWRIPTVGRGGGFGSGTFESGEVKNQYRYLHAIDFEGKKADFYELVFVRTANKMSRDGLVVVQYARTTRTWYTLDGKFLKKTEETMIIGRPEMLRETTTYEYDPKGLKIEAPAIKQ